MKRTFIYRSIFLVKRHNTPLNFSPFERRLLGSHENPRWENPMYVRKEERFSRMRSNNSYTIKLLVAIYFQMVSITSREKKFYKDQDHRKSRDERRNKDRDKGGVAVEAGISGTSLKEKMSSIVLEQAKYLSPTQLPC